MCFARRELGAPSLIKLPSLITIPSTFFSKSLGKIVVFQSDNDPYVPLEKTKQLAKSLDVELKIIKNAGHFNEKAGYIKFPELLEDIKCVE